MLRDWHNVNVLLYKMLVRLTLQTDCVAGEFDPPLLPSQKLGSDGDGCALWGTVLN